MDEMKADMGGAAVLLGTIYAAAKLNVKINVRGRFLFTCIIILG